MAKIEIDIPDEFADVYSLIFQRLQQMQVHGDANVDISIRDGKFVKRIFMPIIAD